jgi:aconitate hydratase
MSDQVSTPLGERTIHRLSDHADPGTLSRIPYSIRVLLESVIRNQDGLAFLPEHIEALAAYDATNVGETETPFMPGRVVLQDFTGVPAVVDLAAMRAAIVRMTGDVASAQKINPLVPSDLVIDHSVQVDAFGSDLAMKINSRLEFERNRERYEFLKWGQQAFDNFSVVPPATGIVHQVNLEYLAKVVWDDGATLYPDSLVGTDSHTTMINGLGVVGWGVGGIEAEAVMVGQPIYMLIPEVVGFKLVGSLPNGATATDLVLRVTEMLRAHGVVGKFVEFHGPGLADMPLANRATIANMAPEYGATVGFFTVDEQTIRYLRQTGRPEELVEAVEWYYKEQGLWLDTTTQPVYSSELELDLSTIVPALAGPKRPQDRIDLTAMQETWNRDLVETFGHTEPLSSEVTYEGETFDLEDGDVVIAAITSCTNTSNPSVMIGAGLLAKHAVAKGLTRKPWVKTSLAPGSKVVTDYLEQAELTPYLEKLGFHTVGYGCTTCIGNSGPLPDEIAAGVEDQDLVVTSVLSGNRNFEGRISPHVKANYLASPPLVVAYALAGTVDIDFDTDPIGTDPGGNPVMLSDIWPSATEIAEVVGTSVETEQFTTEYGNVFEGSDEWKAIATSEGDLYEWNEDSTYVQEPPFFEGLSQDVAPIAPITGARVLVKVGDSVTTDHISPAGNIAEDAPAGRFLLAKGVAKKDFNSYGSRRGNDRVMTRGTFANIRVRNQLAPGTEGGWTTDFTTGQVTSIYEASLNYKAAGTPLVVLAGIDYGMGSSRDWAAKGTFLLGVKAVIAKSFERIHRSNLIGMGVLPLTFAPGDDADALGLDGTEMFSVEVDDSVVPRQDIPVVATKADGTEVRFTTTCRLDTPVEVQYYRNGGILHTVLLRMARED